MNSIASSRAYRRWSTTHPQSSSIAITKRPENANQNNDASNPHRVDMGWWKMYESLCDYKRIHGHCNVPDSSEDRSFMSEWVKRQRKLYQQGRVVGHDGLSQIKIRALERIGFVWKMSDALWFSRLERLRRFNREHGHCNVPRNTALGSWVQHQISDFKRMEEGSEHSNMTSCRVESLVKAGLKLHELAYPIIVDDDDEPCDAQEAAREVECTVMPKAAKGLAWQTPSPNSHLTIPSKSMRVSCPGSRIVLNFTNLNCWNYMYRRLAQFKQRWTHCHVPQTNTSLTTWIRCQQAAYQYYRGGSGSVLNAARVKALDALGFIWDVVESEWVSFFQELCRLNFLNRDCRVPVNYNHPELRGWVFAQRLQYKAVMKGKRSALTPQRIQALKSIGFCFLDEDELWDSMYHRILLLKKQRGKHCTVSWKDHPSLAEWLLQQSQSFAQMGESTSDRGRAAKLQKIGCCSVSDAEALRNPDPRYECYLR